MSPQRSDAEILKSTMARTSSQKVSWQVAKVNRSAEAWLTVRVVMIILCAAALYAEDAGGVVLGQGSTVVWSIVLLTAGSLVRTWNNWRRAYAIKPGRA